MKIKYLDNNYGGGINFIIKEVELCCKTMRSALEQDYINVDTGSPYYNTKQPVIGFVERKYNSTTYIPQSIVCCPYCGKKILLEKIGESNIRARGNWELNDDFNSCSFKDNKYVWKME